MSQSYFLILIFDDSLQTQDRPYLCSRRLQRKRSIHQGELPTRQKLPGSVNWRIPRVLEPRTNQFGTVRAGPQTRHQI